MTVQMADARAGGITDVVVIGGGPAGSTAANLLAAQGHRVVLLEKARHPRFHIGESLLPANLPLFERLGVAAEVRAIGMEKRGAEFVSTLHGRTETYQFADAWCKSMPFAYQVRRSEFDAILIRRAARQGANVIEDCRVRKVDLSGGTARPQVEVEYSDGSHATWQPRMVIDASGRDTLLSSQLGLKRRNPRHNSAALYAHFSGVPRAAGSQAGNIAIYWFDHGWFWFIPLADGCTSVGAVVWPYYLKSRAKPVREFFLDTIQLCAPLAERLAPATLTSGVEATGNYSYTSTRSHGDGYLLIGDAFAFIDPVFSSGVWLAMNSGAAAAVAIDVCLRDPAAAPAALRRFDRVMVRGPRKFSWFIYRVTSPIMRDLFMNPRNPLRMKDALLSVLAGDIFERPAIWPSLWAFKGVYFLTSMFNFRRSLAGLRGRRHNISDPGAAASAR